MRLLRLRDDGGIGLTDHNPQSVEYAILSHTWGRDDEEVTFKDIQDGAERAKSKVYGYRKIEFCGKQASRDGLEYFWVDTCCIDKSNNVELNEAINSMFRWYRNAAKCYVYLADVSTSSEGHIDEALRGSRWFTRGWTLQELIAPASVEFFSSDGKQLGDKKSLERQLVDITGIPPAALQGAPLESFSIDQRMMWVEKRTTKKEEDKAYCLLGIFSIFMVPIYGEGTEHAFYRLNQKIKKRVKAAAGRNLSEGTPMIRNDAIFLQERLLIRDDVWSFLTEAFSCSGHVRVVLHGLPGIGKSTMARSFAYHARESLAILWIPCDSEAAIKNAFEHYLNAFLVKWLIVFDGLDDPLINIQQYLFADLGESKILITTRNKDLAWYIKATHPFPMSPMDGQTGHDLLSLYMNPDQAPPTALEDQAPCETEARRRIVKELGGLPLAIAVVGAALRKESGVRRIESKTYLAWADEVKDVLLEKDPEFLGYPSSVWKAFQFSFQGILQGTGISQYAALMAHFAASCDDASNLAEYIRLYRNFRAKNTANTRGSTATGNLVVGQLRFLDTGNFDLAIRALATVNMVTVNWMEGGPDDVPYIEMHSLVRRWLGSTNHMKVFAYAGSKMWLLGFGMYSLLNGSRVGASRFEPLLKEVSKTILENPRVLDGGQVLAFQAVFPLLLDAQAKLFESVGFLPAGSAQRSRLRQFSRDLESEMLNSYDEGLDDIDWNSVFQSWVRELGEQVEYAVESDAKKDDYTLEDFFLDTLDSHRCIPIAFDIEAPDEFRCVGRTDAIEDIMADITARTESLLARYLTQESLNRLPAITPEKSDALVNEWFRRREKDITEIFRTCLAEVFAKLQSPIDAQRLATELPSPSSRTEVVGDQSFGATLPALLTLSDPSNAFFVVLRRTVKAATDQFLQSSPAIEILDGQKDTFRDICELAIREGFGDRASDAFHSEPLAAEAGTNTMFSMLWDLAWHARFPGDLDSLIAAKVFNAISDDPKDAAEQGFCNAFENYLYNGASFVDNSAHYTFQVSAIGSLFHKWLSSERIDPLGDDEDSDGEEPTYVNLMHGSKQQTMSAMKSTYEGHANISDEGSAVQALKSLLDCRKAIHDEVMERLNDPELTDRTGLGPFFAMMHSKDSDRSLRLACSALQEFASEDFVGSLDHLEHAENTWAHSRPDTVEAHSNLA